MHNDEGVSAASLDAAWEGVLVTYTERDAPGGAPYQRQVPGWKCRACGWTLGTSRLPPSRCGGCGREWKERRP